MSKGGQCPEFGTFTPRAPKLGFQTLAQAGQLETGFKFPISNFEFESPVFRVHVSQRNGGTTDKKDGEARRRDS